MCYKRDKAGIKPLPRRFFAEMIPYLTEITDQVALGGGEPFTEPEFVERFSKECSEYGLICNVTTNGTMSDRIVKYSKHVTMVSVSYDRYKVKNPAEFMLLLKKLNDSGIRVGVNLLVDRDMFNPPAKFVMLVHLFFLEAERVFALYPKNWEFVPILDYKDVYYYLTNKYKHFYVDDLTYKILTENRYRDWSEPCHYGQDIININWDGTVTGCSFSDEVLLRLEKPADILKIAEVEIEPRFSCPYLNV
jgi:MoaA/NifB/PqqE/SkfB family radical SAM enzyme